MTDPSEETIELKLKTAALLRQVVEGTRTAAQAIDIIGWADTEAVGQALHALEHYDSDADIRDYDKAYQELQQKAIVAMAERLEKGEDIDRMPLW
jgi:hypothetical protein